MTSWHCTAFGGGEAEMEVLVSSLVSSDRTHRNASKLHQGNFRLDMRKHFFTEWSGTGTGFLERWLMPQACQCLRGV